MTHDREPLVRFGFEGLHPDTAFPLDDDPSNDGFWILRFVARTFAVHVGDDLLFDEVEFPVIELADVLERWRVDDMPRGAPLDYEVSGGAAGTLTIRSAPAGWLVDSVHRPTDAASPLSVGDAAVEAGIRGFVDALAVETAREYAYDVRALLGRMAGVDARGSRPPGRTGAGPAGGRRIAADGFVRPGRPEPGPT